MRFPFLTVQLAVWTGFALLTRYTWLNMRPPSWTWITWYMGLGLLISSLLRPLILALTRRAVPTQMGGILLGGIGLGLLWRLLFNSLEYHVLESANNAFKFWGYFHNGKSSVVQLLAWGFGYWGFLHHTQSLSHQKNAAEAHALAQETKLRLLQFQIQPHFLFNALAGLDTLLVTQRVDQARDLLGHLVRFLRFAVDQAAHPVAQVPLHQELAWIEAYLAVEQRRFGDRLEVCRQVETHETVMVPAGILMPIIENALKHGIHSAPNGGRVSLHVAAKNGEVWVTITNTIPAVAVSGETTESFGLGLANTRERMHHTYRIKERFLTQKSETEFQACFRFPGSSDAKGAP